jgi:ABC-2 type transport system ATP-binding protein
MEDFAMFTAVRSLDVERGRLIDVRGLRRCFGTREAVARLSLSVAPGEIVSLVGSNGSGKTTSLRILAGLKPDAGEGSVVGFDLVRQAAEIRRHVGYMSQRNSLYGALSVRENLMFRAQAFGLPQPTEAVAATMERFRLQPFERQPAGRLSGGWARILQLAVALIHAPSVVILDEPTAGLDMAARQATWRHLTHLAGEGKALVLSTHDVLDAGRCTRIVLLSQGQVLASGAPSELMRSSGITVLALIAPRASSLVDLLLAIPGVIASYASGGTVRVIVRPGTEQQVISFAEARNLAVGGVEPTLEDTFLALAPHAFRAMLQ